MRYLLAIVLAFGVLAPANAHRWEVHSSRGTYLGIYSGRQTEDTPFGRIYNEELEAFYVLGGSRDLPLSRWKWGYACTTDDCTGECYTGVNGFRDGPEDGPPPQGIFDGYFAGAPDRDGVEDNQVVVTGPATIYYPEGQYHSWWDGEQCVQETGDLWYVSDETHFGWLPLMRVRFAELDKDVIYGLDPFRSGPYELVSVGDTPPGSEPDLLRRLEAVEGSLRELRQGPDPEVLAQAVSRIETNLNALSNRVSDDVRTLRERLDGLEARMDELDGRDGRAPPDVTGLIERLDALEERLRALELRRFFGAARLQVRGPPFCPAPEFDWRDLRK